MTEPRGLPPNTRLRDARLGRVSPSGSGRPMSRQELADAINADLAARDPAQATLDAGYIGKLERGEHRWPSHHRRAAFRRVLDVPGDAQIGFYINRAVPTPRTADDGPRSADDADPQRRLLITSITAVAAASGLFGPPRRRRIGATDITRLDSIVALYRTMDYEHGGGALRDQVSRFAQAASALLSNAEPGPWGAQLAAAVAGARQLAGWTSFDAGHHNDALRHWLAAERAALACDDRRLTARIRYCQARQFQHLRHNADALDTLRLAHTHLGDHATPALHAMLYGAQAASLAAVGDHPGAHTALAQASAYFDDIDPTAEPAWMRFYDRGELLAQYGRVHRDLARADRRRAEDAVHWVSAAIDAFGPQHTRSTILNEVGLCSALMLAGDTDRAIAVGATVIAHGQRLTSRRVLDRITNLRRDIPRDTTDSALTDFRHALARIGADTP